MRVCGFFSSFIVGAHARLLWLVRRLRSTFVLNLSVSVSPKGRYRRWICTGLISVHCLHTIIRGNSRNDDRWMRFRDMSNTFREKSPAYIVVLFTNAQFCFKTVGRICSINPRNVQWNILINTKFIFDNFESDSHTWIQY